MTPPESGGVVVGAYALFAGRPPEELPAAYRALEGLTTAGALEMPLAEVCGETPGFDVGPDGLPTLVPAGWGVVVTCIPAVMGRLAADPRYGIASTDEDGRAVAVADVRRALDVARRAAELSGRQRVRAVEIHSAPRDGGGSATALAASLAELLSVDGAGAQLAIEHCDAARPGRRPEKGFLEIEDELAAIDAVDDPRVGLTVNWGRSAIEGRSASTPEEHVALAASRGRLAGLMFSGASAVAGVGGGAWEDWHVAPRGAGPTPDDWRDSLLDADRMRRTLAACAGTAPSYVGMKVTAGPASRSVAERVEIARAALEMLRSAVPEPAPTS
ncbi:conserved hypothetical protein [Beutenbergia cavernae DSM 12333]|uniref:DUF4862 domain-containing protein n=1 Tax=Beutenbergia cavernae (strain ATCC BAA-8 / DSM 12333 / CCUG 43141 / JCM 11478 / NBRC 16432 / NCIMB 13614 / HKI 0122) TaxID=471853 RepID=C5C3V0_BEUC1|nr:DUF4862 family protein [Beutenbergia cavernae]ACQ82009.1 conserved hypothetical protein [Beutenbergia cavernae DSM 12333]